MSPPLTVRVGATSANLGSGFDVIGICWDWYDVVSCAPAARTTIEVLGPEADRVPRGEDHLVIRSVRAGLRSLGAPSQQGLALECRNSIPHARGLGSSASAIVAGLSLAWGLVRAGESLSREWVAEQAVRIEGHPDNVLPATYGGAVLAWGGGAERVGIDVAPRIRARVWVPELRVPTAEARSVLPDTLDRTTATGQAVSLALLIEALRGREDLLLAGTQGEWHQQARAPLMPDSVALVASLRQRGVAATISGAGPTVVALGTADQLAAADSVSAPGFVGRGLNLGAPATLLASDQRASNQGRPAPM